MAFKDLLRHRMSYLDYLTTDDWRLKRATKHARHAGARRRCAICGSQELLNVHHLNYRNLFDVQQSDLRLLCRKCHFTAHDLHKREVFRFKSDSHQHRFAVIKNHVKKARFGTTQVKMPRFYRRAAKRWVSDLLPLEDEQARHMAETLRSDTPLLDRILQSDAQLGSRHE